MENLEWTIIFHITWIKHIDVIIVRPEYILKPYVRDRPA